MSPPPPYFRHWTVRTLARRPGTVVSSTHGILKDNGPKPHQVKIYKVSRDLRPEIKVRDFVGDYIDPLEHAVVFSVDKRTQIHARRGGHNGPCA